MCNFSCEFQINVKIGGVIVLIVLLTTKLNLILKCENLVLVCEMAFKICDKIDKSILNDLKTHRVFTNLRKCFFLGRGKKMQPSEYWSDSQDPTCGSWVVVDRDARYTDKSVLYRIFDPDTDRFSTIQIFLKLFNQLRFFRKLLCSILKAL